MSPNSASNRDAVHHDSPFNPAVFRFCVRTPECRYGAIKEAAKKFGIDPGRLVQALFDGLDLSPVSADIADAVARHRNVWPSGETAAELARRAAQAGLTVKELKVWRALREAAGRAQTITPRPEDVAVMAMVPVREHDSIYDRLMVKGRIAVAPGRYGYHTFRIVDHAE